jgi:hypothetical protein
MILPDINLNPNFKYLTFKLIDWRSRLQDLFVLRPHLVSRISQIYPKATKRDFSRTDHGPPFTPLSAPQPCTKQTSERASKCMLLSKLSIPLKTYIPILSRKVHIPSFLSLLRSHRPRLTMSEEFRMVWVDCEVHTTQGQLTVIDDRSKSGTW